MGELCGGRFTRLTLYPPPRLYVTFAHLGDMKVFNHGCDAAYSGNCSSEPFYDRLLGDLGHTVLVNRYPKFVTRAENELGGSYVQT